MGVSLALFPIFIMGFLLTFPGEEDIILLLPFVAKLSYLRGEVKSGICFETTFYLLNDIKFFVENIEK